MSMLSEVTKLDPVWGVGVETDHWLVVVHAGRDDKTGSSGGGGGGGGAALFYTDYRLAVVHVGRDDKTLIHWG